MYELVLSDPQTMVRYSKIPIASELQAYLEWMSSQGYARSTMYGQFFYIASFGRYLKARRAYIDDRISEYLEAFLSNRIGKSIKNAQTTDPERLSKEIEHSIKQFLTFLVQSKRIPPFLAEKSILLPFFQNTMDNYLRYLIEDRALATATIQLYERYACRLFTTMQDMGLLEWTSLSPGIVQHYLVAQGKTIHRRGMHCVCCALRSFIRFLRMEGHAIAPQLENFPHPRIYRQEEIPSFLNTQQVKNVLDCVDRSTTVGIRDYAVLLLLLTYGMRASEVTRLTLDDIDWSDEKIHLRDRKSGRSDIMPLSAIVGEALLEYLQKVRPKSPYRHVFLRLHAPLRPFYAGSRVTGIVRKYLLAAGIDLPHIGAHVMRYTCAHRLLKEGFSYKAIGDYLGHYSAGSTSVYLKVDLEGLLQVAQNDGEELL